MPYSFVRLIAPQWNLEPLLVKALDPKHGYGWSPDFAHAVAEEYRRFSTLRRLHPYSQLVPSPCVADFWHLHWLHPAQYAADCAAYFGAFPPRSFSQQRHGMAAIEQLRHAWQRTLHLYQMHFGAVPALLWQAGSWGIPQPVPGAALLPTAFSDKLAPWLAPVLPRFSFPR